MKALVVEVAICTGESHQLKPISLSLTSPMCTIGVLPTSKTVAGGVYYNNGKIALASVAPSLLCSTEDVLHVLLEGKTRKNTETAEERSFYGSQRPEDPCGRLVDPDGCRRSISPDVS